MPRDAQRVQMVADLVALDQTYGGVSAEMMVRAANGDLTVEELADYEDAHGLAKGLVAVSGPYVHPSFLTDGRIALESDPTLDPQRRELALRYYERWTRPA